jgi:hypothetical protein
MFRFSGYIQDMRHCLLTLAATALWLFPAPALAGAGSFTLINGTGVDISSLSIRRTGTDNWQALAAAPAPGAGAPVAFSDPDCAFDIRASVTGGTATWTGVNLCGTSRVTLQRRASGETWVDYD